MPALLISMALTIAVPAVPEPLTNNTRIRPLPASVKIMLPAASTATPCASLVLELTEPLVNRHPSPCVSNAVPVPLQPVVLPLVVAVEVRPATVYT